MKLIERYSNEILSKPMFRVLFCFAICALFYAVVFCIYPIQFETNDDYGNMYIYAGYFSGEPYPIIMHLSTFLGYIITGLYRLFPGFPCYSIFFIAIMFFSSVIVLYCIIETANRYKTSFIISVLFCIFFLFVFTLRQVVLLQFTSVAAFPAAAAIALAITFEPLSKRRTIMRFSLIAVLTLFSYIIRTESLTSALVILCSVFFFKFLRNKEIVFMALPVLLFVLVGTNMDKNVKAKIANTPEWAPHNTEPTRGVSMLGETIIPPEYLDPIEQYCIGSWCHLTEYMTTDFVPDAYNLTEVKSSPESNSVKVERGKEALLPYFQNRHSRFLYFVLVAMFLFAFFMRSIISSEQKTNHTLGMFCVNRLFLIFAFILFHGFIAYLCLNDRHFFPERVQYMLMLLFAPYIIIALCALCGKLQKKDFGWLNNETSKKFFNSKAHFFIILALIVCTAAGIRLLSVNELKARKNILEGMNNTMEKVALRYPEYLFIYDASLIPSITSPFKVFGVRKPVNLMFWGGWTWLTPTWIKQIQRNGLDKLDYKTFLNDNVFLMSAWDINTNYSYNAFFAYMGNKFSEEKGFFNTVGEFPYDTGTIYIYKFFTAEEDDSET